MHALGFRPKLSNISVQEDAARRREERFASDAHRAPEQPRRSRDHDEGSYEAARRHRMPDDR